MAPIGPDRITKDVSLRDLGAVDRSFYLIGVGASAGGMEAIQQLISKLPSDFPHSLVIVQHISPDHKSLMSKILGRLTALPVLEVTDNLAVEPGHIYLIPARSNIVIQGTKGDSRSKIAGPMPGEHLGLRFSLIDQAPRPNLNLPIDVFFHSLAEAVGDRAIAVVLSGSGSDGSRGLRSIKDRDGFVLVQDPKMAAFDGMPRSAIATGIADLVLAPENMMGEINRYLGMRDRGIANVEEVFDASHNQFSSLIALISKEADIDFSLYKDPMLKRRIARRMALLGFRTLAEYLLHLQRDPSEVNALCQEFLVGVTNFFRDLPIWKNLSETVLEKLFQEGNPDEPVRVWSAGCSTGEEAYSIAMLLEDYREEHNISREFRVFATDVNEAAILVAKEGEYAKSVQEEIPEPYLRKGYLVSEAGALRVATHIRNRIVFAQHNVTKDAPYTRTDLILCRNLLIYLSPDVTAKIMTRFSFSLRKGGFLQLGASETPGPYGAMFETLVNRFRIFRNTRELGSMAGTGSSLQSDALIQHMPRSRQPFPRGQAQSEDISALLQGTLNDTNACVCITDASARIIRTFGDHSKLLNIPKIGFSANLLELVDERLRSTVELVLSQSEVEGLAEKRRNVRMVGDTGAKMVELICRKIPWEAEQVAFALTFKWSDEVLLSDVRDPARAEAPNVPTQAYIQHLEKEVQSLQDMLSATAEDLGVANAQLQANNDELHRVNVQNMEKIAALEARSAQEAEVERHAQEVHRFAYVTAHDLVQPVNTISSCVTMLLEELPDKNDPQVSELIAYLQAAMSRMKARLVGVQDYAGIQDQNRELELVDLRDVAKSCLLELKERVDEAGATVEIGELPSAQAVRSLMELVFRNVLGNALKFRSSERSCAVKITEVGAKAGLIGVRIADNGIGIEPEHHRKVFELFSQLHTPEDYPGLGLGLAVSERIISHLGGRIWVEKGDAGGSAITFTLPKVPEAAEAK